MEKIVKTPEPRADAQIEGFALEHLIDMQRDRTRFAGEVR